MPPHSCIVLLTGSAMVHANTCMDFCRTNSVQTHGSFCSSIPILHPASARLKVTHWAVCTRADSVQRWRHGLELPETHLEPVVVDPGVPASVDMEARLARKQDAARVCMLACQPIRAITCLAQRLHVWDQPFGPGSPLRQQGGWTFVSMLLY